MSRYMPIDYRGEHDPDYPRIRTAVDDDRPAREDEVEHCAHCGAAVLEGDLQRHMGERRCERCRPLCCEFHDAEVSEPEDFCKGCIYAMGFEV